MFGGSQSAFAGDFNIDEICQNFTGAQKTESARLTLREQIAVIAQSPDPNPKLAPCRFKAELLSHYLIPENFLSRQIQQPQILDDQRRILNSEFGMTRQDLMREYLRENLGVDTVETDPALIVLHWTGSNTVDAAINNFSKVILGGRPELSQGGRVNVGCHFIVGRDGDIHQIMPTRSPVRHVIGLNRIALCIENVGGPQFAPTELTQAQVIADSQLIHFLVEQYPRISAVIGHKEYLNLRGTYLFEEIKPHYVTIKPDPGDQFMKSIRQVMFSPSYGGQ
jgi:N-acetyl-anhydromuramyl-L-alanine amidase AmpD